MLGHRTLNVEDYLAIFKRRWWIVVIPTIILPIAAIALTFVIPPVSKRCPRTSSIRSSTRTWTAAWHR